MAMFRRLIQSVCVVSAATSSVAFASPVTYTAAIKITQASNSAFLGYVTNTPTAGAYFGYNPNIASALQVTFTLDSSLSSGSGIDLAMTNGPAGFPDFGLVQGRDSTNSTMQAGSYNYLYLSGTNQTPANSTPQTVGNAYTSATGLSRTSESAVWMVNLLTDALTPVWTNPDNSTPTLALFSQSSLLYAGGDQGQFNSRFPAAVTAYTMSLDILSSVGDGNAVPEPDSLALVGLSLGGLAFVRRRKPH